MSGHPGAAEYLWRAQACAEAAELDEAQLAATRGDSAGYYAAAAEHGEAPGRLAGAMLAHLGLRDGQVPDETTALRLLRCQDPETGEQLGSKLKVPRSRDQRLREALRAAGDDITEEQARAIARQVDKATGTGRAFYDVTFSASKSVSVYYAMLRQTGRHELADAVLSAHDEAVHHAMAYMEQHTWTRTGRHGRAAGASTGRMEQVDGLIRLHFQHSTSRGKDPHLHTHVAVINRVRCADGKWRAIHGQAWGPHKAAIAARYEAKLAELIEARTPARLVVREDGMAREIIGLDEELLAASSQRTQQVAEAEARALRKFREEYGREPTPAEARRIHRVAGLESRSRKDGTSPAQQYREWARRVGGDLDEVIEEVHRVGAETDFWRTPVDVDETETAAVREALAEVQARSSTWDVGVLTAAISMRLPAEEVERAAELAREATEPGNRYGVVDLTRRDLPNTPEDVMDDRHRPVWRDPALDGAKYALADHLSAETQLVSAARAHTVTPWTEEEIAALRRRWRESGDPISDQQAAAVCAVLRSPRAGDVLIAAAGTGKSFLAGRLADAWRSRGGVVISTATSQIATSVLAAETQSTALNTTRLLQAYGPDNPAAGHRLPAGALILLDEANMTSTEQLRRVQQLAQRDGAKIVFFGDPAQLGAVGAGGGLELMAQELGTVATLTEVRRFSQRWEREASTRLRAGDLSVLDEYERHGRLHGGTREAMVSSAVSRYVAAHLKGRSAALITATNAEAADVSRQVQQWLLHYDPARERLSRFDRYTPVAQDMHGNDIYCGDLLQWRENVYHDFDGAEQAPLINRERVTVEGRVDDRVLLRREDGTTAMVPRDWLTTRAQLGYAGTEHAYEGVTVDEGYALTPGYVAMTRGREVNEAWLTTREPGDEHGERVETTVRQLFEERFSEAGQARAALQVWREELDAERHTASLAAAWDEATKVVMRDAMMDAIGAHLGWDAADRVSTERGAPVLRQALTQAVLCGYDYDQVLKAAIEARPLDRVDDLAAVLAARVRRHLAKVAPEQQPSTWSERAALLADRGEVGRFLADVGQRLDARVEELGLRILADPPQWALAQLGEPPSDALQCAEWCTRAGRIAAYRERAGISDALPSLGARPHDDDLAHQVAWQDAAIAAGRPVDEAEYHALPDSDLEAKRARWRRLLAGAPAYVEPELGRAHDAQRQAEADAVLLRAKARSVADVDARTELERRAAECERHAAEAAARVNILSALHRVRERWTAEHEADQDAALEAERELKRRGRVLDGALQEPEQTELFSIATEYATEAERGAEREQEVETQQEAAVDVDPAQAALFEVEPTPEAVVRQQPVALELDEDQAANQVHVDAAATWEARTRAEAMRDTVARAEIRARYATEMLERRVAERQRRDANRAADEAERQARLARDEAERGAEREQEATPELNLF